MGNVIETWLCNAKIFLVQNIISLLFNPSSPNPTKCSYMKKTRFFQGVQKGNISLKWVKYKEFADISTFFESQFFEKNNYFFAKPSRNYQKIKGVNARKPEKLSDCITYRRNVLVTKHHGRKSN